MKWEIGKRVTLEALTVTRVSHYQAKGWDNESEQTKWRYAFNCVEPNPEYCMFVYTGKYLGLKTGDCVSIRATIKRLEREYKSIRLARVAVLDKGTIKERLLI